MWCTLKACPKHQHLPVDVLLLHLPTDGMHERCSLARRGDGSQPVSVDPLDLGSAHTLLSLCYRDPQHLQPRWSYKRAAKPSHDEQSTQPIAQLAKKLRMASPGQNALDKLPCTKTETKNWKAAADLEALEVPDVPQNAPWGLSSFAGISDTELPDLLLRSSCQYKAHMLM